MAELNKFSLESARDQALRSRFTLADWKEVMNNQNIN